jgi:hypothetical protein
MNIEELKSLSHMLSKSPVYGKRLYLWNGDLSSLEKILPQKIIKLFNIAYLPISSDSFINDKYLQKEIRTSLKHHLSSFYSELKGQQILIVQSPEILARYNIGLNPFYDHYICDRTMVILVVPIFENLLNIPKDCIDIDENATLRYFQNILYENDIIW